MAETSDEYNDIRVGVERTLVGMAQRHHLVEQYVFKKGAPKLDEVSRN